MNTDNDILIANQGTFVVNNTANKNNNNQCYSST